jgi:hypothetical protein
VLAKLVGIRLYEVNFLVLNTFARRPRLLINSTRLLQLLKHQPASSQNDMFVLAVESAMSARLDFRRVALQVSGTSAPLGNS